MHQNKTKINNQHQPVMLDEVIEFLKPEKGNSYLDLTAGYGGHASAVLNLTGSPDRAVLVDRDPSATKYLEELFNKQKPVLLSQDFLSAAKQLAEEEKQFDLIFADLGVSSPHFNEGSRGFSIQLEGPLDMRMDQRQPITAEEIINTASEEDISAILKEYGEEPKARAIAKTIVANRPLRTTSELKSIVEKVWKGRSRVHPATRTFQAFRIAVNDELSLLSGSFDYILDLLAPGGRIAIISFHSLEDRLVKNFLAENSGGNYDSALHLLTKHPIRPSDNEIAHNPRARSAKLRAAVKIKRKGIA